MTGAAIHLQGLTKRFGDTVAVDDLSVTLAAGSCTALLGPSGCGKSTTLAMIAGLTAPDAGDVRFDDRSVLDVSPERRDVGLVFQKPLLFPHLSIEQNVAFGLRMRRVDRSETRTRVREMLDRVELGDLAGRRVGELSGGQEQRVALARALVLRPSVLLLDEPFSQLDAGLRVQMRTLVRRLHDESALTTVFVTHDQGEAVEVADTITLLLAGRLAGQGTPEVFYTHPPSLAAARFFGVTNEITGRVTGGVFTSSGRDIQRPAALPDGPAVLIIRPETLRLHPNPLAGTVPGVVVPGVAVAARFAGTHVIVDVTRSDAGTLTVHQPVGTVVTLGSTVHVELPVNAGTVFSVRPNAAGLRPPR